MLHTVQDRPGCAQPAPCAVCRDGRWAVGMSRAAGCLGVYSSYSCNVVRHRRRERNSNDTVLCRHPIVFPTYFIYSRCLVLYTLLYCTLYTVQYRIHYTTHPHTADLSTRVCVGGWCIRAYASRPSHHVDAHLSALSRARAHARFLSLSLSPRCTFASPLVRAQSVEPAQLAHARTQRTCAWLPAA